MAEVENVETEIESPASVPMNETPADGPGSGRSKLRSQLEKNFETSRKAEPAERPAKGKQYTSRARTEFQTEEAEPEAEAAVPAETEGTEPAEGTQPEIKAPEGWTREAKAEWAQTPPAVQAAVAKREADMAKGVKELKDKYSELDTVLQPRLDVIRRNGHTPAAAVNQLFAWFDALSQNPTVAFPALANSFRFDLRTVPGLLPLPQQQQPPVQAVQPVVEGQPQTEVSPAVQKYIDDLNQKLAGLQQGFSQQLGQLNNSFQQQSQAKTEEILYTWSKDKPYFEDVRRMMAHLISSQAVQPLANGNADLDTAYDMALYALPDVRQKILAEQAEKAEQARQVKILAEKKAQEAQAAKARKASGSLTGGAPGSGVEQKPGKSKGKSVRDSIEEARRELSE